MTISRFGSESKLTLRRFLFVAAVASLFSGVCFAQQYPGKVIEGSTRNYNAWLSQEVRHQLMEVPWYTVFDNLEFQVNGTEVTLLGQAVNPVLKHDAENAVKNIEGVTKVIDNIQVLPVSPMDDGIRRAEYRAIYGAPQLQRYAAGVLPSIHIIVTGGHVTLMGWVASQSDKNVADIQAKGVSNAFSIENDLRVEPRARS